MSIKLDEIRIPKPCQTDWERMKGSDRMRYCEECKKHVYNLSKMSRREAEALIATQRGELCARVVRKPDGTVLTQEIISSAQQGIRRASPVASAVVTAILTISSSAVAQSPALVGKPIPTITQESGDKKPDPGPQTEGGVASISGTVIDSMGAAITAAVVRLTNKQTGFVRTISPGEDGAYNFVQVEAGTYTLMVQALGFATEEYQEIVAQQGEARRIDVKMASAFVSLGGAIAVPVFPLRELYDKSELIVVARVGQSSKVEKDGESTLITTRLNVSSTLKGSGHERVVDVYHWVYGEDTTYIGGVDLLIFLNRRPVRQKGEKAGYEVLDARRGVKNLPEADLQVYLKRINELAAIEGKEKPDPAEIVEWLVRCAEVPATRWEGVYELGMSAYSLPEPESEDSEETAEEAEAAVAEEEAPVEEAESEAAEEAEETVPEPEQASEPPLAALLTVAQKERLTQVLFNIKTLAEDDRSLVELVQHWDDGRLVPYLLAQLKQMEENPSRFAEDIVNLISDALGDREVNAFAVVYGDNISYEDLDAEEEAAAAEEAEEPEEAEPDEDAESVEDVEEVEQTEEVEADVVTPAEARQKRSEMLKKFIALVEGKIKK